MSEDNRRKRPMSIEDMMGLCFPQATGEVFKHSMSIGEWPQEKIAAELARLLTEAAHAGRFAWDAAGFNFQARPWPGVRL